MIIVLRAWTCALSDDSTSMKYADDGERIRDLDVILERVTEVATLFDDTMACFRLHSLPALID